MKKTLTIALEDPEILELIRIMLDEDAPNALAFLHNHFKGKARE